MRLSVSEIFSKADKLEDKDEKIEFLRKHWHPTFAKLLNLAFNKKIKWRLPSGLPPTKFEPTQGSTTRLYYEIPRLYRFYDDPENKSPEISRMKREMLFHTILMDLTPEDAELLCNVKDSKWPYKTLPKKFLEEAYPGIINV